MTEGRLWAAAGWANPRKKELNRGKEGGKLGAFATGTGVGLRLQRVDSQSGGERGRSLGRLWARLALLAWEKAVWSVASKKWNRVGLGPWLTAVACQHSDGGIIRLSQLGYWQC